MNDLRDLAERCERAEGADRELDGDIFCALGLAPFVEGAFDAYRAPEYTRSIDAAMTLVPEGWRVGGFSQHDHAILRAKGDWTAWLYQDGRLEPVTGDRPASRFARTGALALCAVALRALAAGDNR